LGQRRLDQLAGIRLVVDDEDVHIAEEVSIELRRGYCGARGRPAAGGRRFAEDRRQVHLERAAAADAVRSRLDCPAVQLHELTRDRQAEPEPAVLA